MKGWLVVNSFLSTDKFKEIYHMLQRAFEGRNCRLEIKRTDELICCVGDKFPLPLPNFVIFWDKDVQLAKRLEEAGVPLFNSSSAIEICDNKILTALALNKYNLPTPKTIVAPKTFENVNYSTLNFLQSAADILHFPMIIKCAYGSFGQQVYLAKTFDEAKEIVQKIGYKDFLLQQFIAESCGRDVRVNVVGDKAVASMLRYNDDDFRSNITNGGKMKAITITPEQEKLAIAACKACGCTFGGVDILFGKDTPIVCEVNSNPHFKSTLECTGIDLSVHIAEYVLGHIC
jgi:ribosomal protein S6--L-glutamate ligase/gamma-F420-2:alpha-L-glutamate ligase